MESFKSEWEKVNPSWQSSKLNLTANDNCVDSDTSPLLNDSKSFSEFTLEHEKCDTKLKSNLTNNSLTKQTLHYVKPFTKVSNKEERSELNETIQNVSFKKRKDICPIEKAKAVIQEFEETRNEQIEDLRRRHGMLNTVQNVNTPQYIQTPDYNEQQFRRRAAIKQRNYRRTDSITRKSISPESLHRSGTRLVPADKSPKDWSEFNSNQLALPLENRLSSRSTSKNRSFGDYGELVNKLYNFDLPSPHFKSFQYAGETGTKEISLFNVKMTKCKPPLTYSVSVNLETAKQSFPTRDQLFHLLSEDRRQTIKNVINAHSKSQPLNKKIESRPWYNKTWRKHSDAECKILENSVGLSFLQTYSEDEEEEENETDEILICSSITTTSSNKSNLNKVADKVCKKDKVPLVVLNEDDKKEDEHVRKTKKEDEYVRKSKKEDEYIRKIKKEDEYVRKNKKDEDEYVRKTKKDEDEYVPRTKKEEDEYIRKNKRDEDEYVPRSKKEEDEYIRKNKRDEDEYVPRSKKEEDEYIRKMTKDEDEYVRKTKKEADEYVRKSKIEKEFLEKEFLEKDKTKTEKSDKSFREIDSAINISTNTVIEDESGILTPEIPLQLQKTIIKVEKDLKDVSNEAKPQDRNKKKKTKKKVNVSSKKKKKKRKRRSSNDESDESVVEKKKKPKKLKPKKEDKPKTEKKRSQSKELKLKKKKKIEKQIQLGDKDSKKSKKKEKEAESLQNKSPLLDDLRKTIKKKLKKKKLESLKKEENIDLLAINRSYKHDSEIDFDTKSKDFETKSKDYTKSKKGKKDVKIVEDADISINELPDYDDFCLEKTVEVEKKLKTPDTDEYRGNWEKDSFASEEENLSKAKLNSSWESDEEIYEKSDMPNDRSRTIAEVSNLEMPLNIKPFKKRNDEGLKFKNDDVEFLKLSLRETLYLEQKKTEDNPVSERKRRWDKTERDLPIESVDSNISSSLEHEYVEFMKAVTSNAQPKPNFDEFTICLDSSESIQEISEDKSEIVIAAEDIPFIPMPDEVKPVPFTISTLDYAPLSLTSTPLPLPSAPLPLSSAPLPLSSAPLPLGSAPLLLTSAPISLTSAPLPFTPFTPTTLTVNLEETFPEIKEVHFPENKETQVPEIQEIQAPEFEEMEVDTNTQSAEDCVTSLSVKDEIEGTGIQKVAFSFATLVLPTKKTLLPTSRLNLDDSDDEKTMKPIEEIRKEFLKSSTRNLDKELSIINKEPITTTPSVKQEVATSTPVTSTPIRIRESVNANLKSEDIVKRERVSYSTGSPRHSPSRNVKSEERNPPRKRSQGSDTSERSRGSSRRESSPKRRRKSPSDRYPDRRKSYSGGKKYSSRRSLSPIRSPRRNLSPKSRSRTKSRYSDKHSSSTKPYKQETNVSQVQRQKSPSIASPLEGLKRSIADSTISDDSLLPQTNVDEYVQSPVSQFYETAKPRRISLDERINIELGWHKNKQLQQAVNTMDENYYFDQNPIVQSSQDSTSNKRTNNVYRSEYSSSDFVQVGNMVQIVPRDLDHSNSQKSRIVQVGNMLQIVPVDLPPPEIIPLPPTPVPVPPEAPLPPPEPILRENVQPSLEDKSERRTEREQRKKEREVRRKEKENRRREKDKLRLIKMKQKTDDMIMRALQLEVGDTEEGEGTLNDSSETLSPTLSSASCSAELLNKSILMRGHRTLSKQKSVQFADGIRPGDGTSPSAGEDLSSPPPTKVLPKEKRYTKTKLRAHNMKKKVKVKIIKPKLLDDSDDELLYELPPPSPPPGSPPPHLFPPRVKTIMNNVHPYLPNTLESQKKNVYCTDNPLMAPQSLSNLQQLHISSGQLQPPLPDSHMHHLAQYQVPALVSSAHPQPIVGYSDSLFGSSQRNSQLYKYSIH